MRRINPKDFTLATRGTSREINRQIVLTLIRTHQPVSRADLSRLMETNRANVTFIVNQLLEEGLVREGARGNENVRGRRPTFLYLNSQKSYAVAVDVRASRTFLMVTDSIGKQISDIVSFPTEIDPIQTGREDRREGQKRAARRSFRFELRGDRGRCSRDDRQ
jgi:N-acetylglucosamine repressor